VISLPPILLGALLIDDLPTHWPSTQALVATIYTGAVPMALGTAAWFALVKLLPAQVAGLSAIAIPIVAIVSGVLILQEPLSVLQALAIASTVAALWLALVPGGRR
jgi:drug/metabolite transporter (DMT)-like permease